MNHFPFHIGDYIKSTVHLTNEEDLTYFRLICHYYDTEKPIPKNTESVAKRLRLKHRTVLGILAEFFSDLDDGWHNKRCDEELVKYHTLLEIASKAGKASAAQRLIARSTPVKRPLRFRSTNQEPRTKNQEPVNPLAPSAAAPDASASSEKRGNGKDQTPVIERLPLNDGTEYEVHESFILEMDRLYPSVDVPATLREMRAWCLTNPANRKTIKGVAAFINRWLAKEQNKHG